MLFGRWMGLLATAAATGLALWYFVPPVGTLRPTDPCDTAAALADPVPDGQTGGGQRYSAARRQPSCPNPAEQHPGCRARRADATLPLNLRRTY